MRVVIASVQTPFVRGGAEMLADSLLRELRRAGHQAEIVTIPFKWYPADRIADAMLVARLMEVEEWSDGPIDRLIGLKFPAYLMRHRNKVLWLLHQYRGAYDLWEAPEGDLRHAPGGALVRNAIREADRLITESRAVFTISRNVSRRLAEHNGLGSEPLYHPPPDADRIATGDFGSYFLFPGRVNETKRQHLAVEALGLTARPVRIVFIGTEDASGYLSGLRRRCDELDLGDRAVWRGSVSVEEKLRLFAGCRGVVVPPLDEDYGYVTLEAMLAGKPVLTCTDSGGPLDFISDAEDGYVTRADAVPIAESLDRLWDDPDLARRLGAAGLERYHALSLDWGAVIDRLLA